MSTLIVKCQDLQIVKCQDLHRMALLYYKAKIHLYNIARY